MLDLEKVADRNRIDRSYDLRTALHTSRVRLMSHSAKRKKAPPPPVVERVIEKVIEKHHHHETQHHHEQVKGIDEAKLAEMMAKILQENQPAQVVQAPAPAADSDAVLKAMAALQEQIANMGGSEPGVGDMPDIDPEHWANLQSAAIEKLSQDVEAGNVKTGKKVILKSSKKLDDLASELE